jgi:(p)ppGpp synthase/HD superfamily hydrolase
MITLEGRAKAYASKAHEKIGQKRKYTGEPYINHPAAVVALVKSVPHTEEMLAAAWLHDVVEDCGVSIEEILLVFGPEVAMLVEELTDVSKPSDGNRAARKKLDREHSAKSCPAAKTIKLADLIDNSISILERDPDFAKVYLHEKRELLPLLKEGDAKLWEMANKLAQEG